MLKSVFEKLDLWINAENQMAARERVPLLKKSEFRVVGQNALLEAHLNLDIASTADVDTIDNANHIVRVKLNELLKAQGMELDPLGNEIWMPEETQYTDIFIGDWVKAMRALPVFVMVSKAKFAVEKNKSLIRQYMAQQAPDEFFELCERHQVDLDAVLKE